MKIPESAKGKSFVEHQSTKTSKDCYVLGNKKNISSTYTTEKHQELLKATSGNVGNQHPQQNAWGGGGVSANFFLLALGRMT